MADLEKVDDARVPDRLARTSALLAASSAVVAVGGLAFWLLASFRGEAEAVASASAAWSGATLAAIAAGAGAAPTLLMLLPQRANPRRLLLGVSAGCALLSGALCGALALYAFPADAGNGQTVLLAAALAALASLGSALDAALVHYGRAKLVLWRNTAASLGKTLLVALVPVSTASLLLATAVPLAISVAVAGGGVLRAWRTSTLPRDLTVRSPARLLAANHVATLGLYGPPLTGPLLAVAAYGPAGYAPYFPTWISVATYASASIAISGAFLSHRAQGNTGRLRDDKALRTLLLLMLTLPVSFSGLLAAPVLLGSSYSGFNVSAVLALILSVPFTTATAASVDVLRANGRLAAGTLLAVSSGISTVALCATAAGSGELAMNSAYLACQAAAGLAGLALVLSTKRQQTRRARQ